MILENPPLSPDLEKGLYEEDFEAEIDHLPLSATVLLVPKEPNLPPEDPVISMPPPESNERYSYAEALGLSLLFYETQRSGPLPSSNRIPWRHESALQDRGLNGEDLTGVRDVYLSLYAV